MSCKRRNSVDNVSENGVIFVEKRTRQCLRSLLFEYLEEIQRKLRDSMGMKEEQSMCNKKVSVVPVYPSFMRWSIPYLVEAARFHPLPVLLGGSLLFFMALEYTMVMVSAGSPPYDVGFVWTQSLHDLLMQRPALNTILAAFNTDFLGSGVDFPVGNVSFFLFFSGHVAGSMIASLDMRRMDRWQMALVFDVLNVLQSLRLLVTRGHYTIDLAVGVGAGWLFDSLAGKYEESKRSIQKDLRYEPLVTGGFRAQATSLIG